MAWTNAGAASDGNAYDFYQQEVTLGCGPAAVATFILLTQGKKIEVSTINTWFAKSEGTKNVTKEGLRDFTTKGSWYDGVIGALSTLKIYALSTKGLDNAAKWAAKVTKKKPGILSIGWWVYDSGAGTWTRNGGHWIVAANVFNNNLICLDPGLATGVNEIAVTNLPDYAVNYGGGAVTGYMDGIIIP